MTELEKLLEEYSKQANDFYRWENFIKELDAEEARRTREFLTIRVPFEPPE
mgnify:FL=1